MAVQQLENAGSPDAEAGVDSAEAEADSDTGEVFLEEDDDPLDDGEEQPKRKRRRRRRKRLLLQVASQSPALESSVRGTKLLTQCMHSASRFNHTMQTSTWLIFYIKDWPG